MTGAKRILVVDVGGTNVKILATGQTQPRKLPSGPKMTPARMVAGIKKLAPDWNYDAVSVGYPGPVRGSKVVAEPHNLGRGWLGFDLKAAFGCPVRLINDAAMQALGSYKGGTMLFLGLGTGLGSALVVNGTVVPLELAHLPWEERTLEEYLGVHGLKENGKRAWWRSVSKAVKHLISALLVDDVVLGGGNAKKLKSLPPGCRLGDNANAFEGGFRLWEEKGSRA
jgi:polyphosphate glucokinase